MSIEKAVPSELPLMDRKQDSKTDADEEWCQYVPGAPRVYVMRHEWVSHEDRRSGQKEDEQGFLPQVKPIQKSVNETVKSA